MRRFVRLCLLFAVCLLSLPAWAEISLYAAPGSSPAMVAEIQKTIDAFNGIVKEEIGATLDEEIEVRLCPGNDCYINDLHQEAGLDLDRARETARFLPSVAEYSKRTIIMRLAGIDHPTVARQRIAHELTHMLQLHFSGTARGMNKANRWIQEGMADWMGALVASRMTGGTGMGAERLFFWRFERLNVLGLLPQRLRAEEIDDADFDRWLAWENEKRQPYIASDLMMLTLAERLGDGIFPALKGYLECVSGFSFESTCFRKHFGVEQKTFYADYETGLTQALKDIGRVEIVSDEVDEADRQEVAKLYRDGLGQLKARFGKDLPIFIRIYLYPDREAMTLSVAKTLGLNPSDAARLSNGVGFGQGLTMHLDLDRLNTPERLAKAIQEIQLGQFKYYAELAGLPDGGWAAQ